MLAFLCDAYDEDEVGGEQRTVLRLHPTLAPIKVAVFPLLRKDGHPELAREVYEALRERVAAEYDDGGNIGKRYRRQDEIGTPFGVTIDHQSLEDGTVTLRDRDSLAQERVPIEGLADELAPSRRCSVADSEGVRLLCVLRCSGAAPASAVARSRRRLQRRASRKRLLASVTRTSRTRLTTRSPSRATTPTRAADEVAGRRATTCTAPPRRRRDAGRRSASDRPAVAAQPLPPATLPYTGGRRPGSSRASASRCCSPARGLRMIASSSSAVRSRSS